VPPRKPRRNPHAKALQASQYHQRVVPPVREPRKPPKVTFEPADAGADELEFVIDPRWPGDA
jgi:hypothetical protein